MRRTTTMVSIVLMLGIGLAGCGDNKKTADSSTATTAPGATAAVATYCKDSLAAETVPDPDIDFEKSTEAEQKAAAKTFVNEKFKPIIDRLKKSVPAAIKEPAQVQFDAIDKVGVDGDFTVLEAPAFKAAEAEVHAYDLANCGWGKVSATAVEYAYQGVPATIEAGVTSFDLSNNGKELHQMEVLKKKDGVTESFDEILQLDDAEAMAKVDTVASSFAAQGESDYGVADLTAGEYIAVCFLPVGFTSQEQGPPENSPPHFTKGMKAEFKVT